MAAPTTRFRVIPQNTATTAIDSAAKRLAAIASQTVVSTGVGNEVDFGTIDISAGAANSGVKTILWGVTADGGNTAVDTFKLWQPAASRGFDQAASVTKFRALSGTDNAAPSTTQNYVVNGVVGSYTWGDIPASEPSQNVWPTDEGAGMVLSTASDDEIMFALYLAIAASETTGTYRGLVSGNELQYSFKYSYS